MRQWQCHHSSMAICNAQPIPDVPRRVPAAAPVGTPTSALGLAHIGAGTAPGLARICAGTRPPRRQDSPTSAPGLAHIGAGTRPYRRRDCTGLVHIGAGARMRAYQLPRVFGGSEVCVRVPAITLVTGGALSATGKAQETQQRLQPSLCNATGARWHAACLPTRAHARTLLARMDGLPARVKLRHDCLVQAERRSAWS
jgi:hypothetical protein